MAAALVSTSDHSCIVPTSKARPEVRLRANCTESDVHLSAVHLMLTSDTSHARQMKGKGQKRKKTYRKSQGLFFEYFDCDLEVSILSPPPLDSLSLSDCDLEVSILYRPPLDSCLCPTAASRWSSCIGPLLIPVSVLLNS